MKYNEDVSSTVNISIRRNANKRLVLFLILVISALCCGTSFAAESNQESGLLQSTSIESSSDQNGTSADTNPPTEPTPMPTDGALMPSPNNQLLPSSSPAPTASPAPIETKKPADIVKFTFAGDVMFDKRIENIIKKNGLAHIFSEVKPFFTASNISMVNLETPISKRGIKENDKQYTFRANPDILKNFTKASGINFVSLANNHILDFGLPALTDTLIFLKKEKINRAGAGENVKLASQATYIKINSHNVAILATSRVLPFYTWHAGEKKPGVASSYNKSVIKNEISEAQKKADIVIVYVHWGNERIEYPIKVQKDLAKLYIDNGADIVIGSHPHVLGGLEFYKNKLIAYSLGNFVFTDIQKDTMMLGITIQNKKISTVKIIPCEIKYFRPVLIKDKNNYDNLIKKIIKLSYGVKIDKNGNVVLPKTK